MRTPKIGSRAHSILKTIHEVGPLSCEAICERFPSISRPTMFELARSYNLPRENGAFRLTEALTKWFADGTSVRAIGAIPVTHTPRPFKPLNHWTTDGSMKDKLRDISFKTASAAPSLVWHD